jgi:hypothetical protein
VIVDRAPTLAILDEDNDLTGKGGYKSGCPCPRQSLQGDGSPWVVTSEYWEESIRVLDGIAETRRGCSTVQGIHVVQDLQNLTDESLFS